MIAAPQKPRATWVVVLGLLAAVAGCATPRVSLARGERSFTRGDYDSVYTRWTRRADDFAFGNLTEILHVSATFEAFEFRWAYVVRYAADHAMNTAERTLLLERSLADSQERHRFVISMATPIYREGDLTSEQSDWRVLLVDSTGHATEPIEVVRIPRPSHDQRIYFPAIHRQRHTFRVAFPVVSADGVPSIDPAAERVTLRFAGAAGTVDLDWNVERGH